MSNTKEIVADTTIDEIHDCYDDTPRSSVDSEHPENLKASSTSATTTTSPTPAFSPSLRLLFSFISKRHLLFLIIPAVCASITAGAIAPFMTQVIGQAFDAFAHFASVQEPTKDARDSLLRNVGIAALTLLGLAFGSFALSSLTSCLWIWIGESNVLALRKSVYSTITSKDLTWFDSHLGSSDDEEVVGAAGLMAKFSSEIDEVRMASSLASGMLIQYLTTAITCLSLAFFRSWQLTLVILSAVPLLIFIQGLSQSFATPLIQYERHQLSIASTLVERTTACIATVKAFNAASLEHKHATQTFDRLRLAARKLNSLWALISGLSQFVIMAMFIQGFWFGSKLVRDGKVSPGDVMAVFWACLIASSNLQMCVPQFIVLVKGKVAIASILSLTSPNLPDLPSSPRKMTPSRCSGSLALHNVTFAYPSRPDIPVLFDVSLFLPANEMTFIVGSSGSGKSTVAHLLQKMYTPQRGVVNLDDINIQYLDDGWLRSHVACVGQLGADGVVILDGKSIYQNIAAALYGYAITKPGKEEIEEASRAALLHEFIRDLPEGYDTLLGDTNGVGLSGGQKQRLAIARARLRNPTVLILDEATSALDVTSRVLIFEAIKCWRQNKTTIVITHDLTQIGSQDFVYVMKDGRVAEQGYRSTLEDPHLPSYSGSTISEFRKMLDSKSKSEEPPIPPPVPPKPSKMRMRSNDTLRRTLLRTTQTKPVSPKASVESMRSGTRLRPLTFGSWMFDVIADLTQSTVAPLPAALPESPTVFEHSLPPLPLALPDDKYTKIPQRRRSSATIAPSFDELLASPTPAITTHGKRFSSPLLSGLDQQPLRKASASKRDTFGISEKMIERSAAATRDARRGNVRRQDQQKLGPSPSTIKLESAIEPTHAAIDTDSDDAQEVPKLWPLFKAIYPSIPHKSLLLVGLLACLASGAMTPIFSFFLSRLLFEVSAGATNTYIINTYGALVLGIAATDGFFLGLKYFIMETCGTAWVTSLRKSAMGLILHQDKSWFDRPKNAPAKLVQILVKDGDDARDLISIVFGQFFVVSAMLGVGMVWALVWGWQLTLAGMAIAPVFAVLMVVQTKLVERCELRNKRARERVAKGYYDTIINIRGIKSMGFDGVFKAQFDSSAEKALRTGVQGAMVEGCTYGLASGLIYFAEAILFYVGAVLISRGTYSYLQMIEVLNLVVFSVTIGSQLMAFTEKIAKSTQAASDFHKLTNLEEDTLESRGSLRPEISGSIRFNDVSFSYPEREDVPVLQNLTFKVRAGECVAIVGASGSGKSTIASLIDRLYEPSSGSVVIGRVDTRFMNVSHLREHISIVTQQPHLFDATVADNIRYGRPSISDVDVEYAAKAAHLHEFIVSLPQGYATHLGENASLISGGQAQRLQIARALVRPSARILLLDECTSSLDMENQMAVLDTVRAVREGGGRTIVMVTHQLEAMRMCDRILVVKDGKVVEQGTYSKLVERKGVFASLERGGEWIGD